MRFLGRAPHKAPPYHPQPPYPQARAELLSRRPDPGRATGPPFGRLFAVVADVGLDDYLVSVYLLADGTISIYTSGGIHSTGLRGAPKVAEAAAVVVEEVEQAIGEFVAVDDLAALPLPDHGHSQILARTDTGDLAAFDWAVPKHSRVPELVAMAMIVTRLARMAVMEGLERVEAGEVRYRLAPEYRQIRSSLLDWLPPAEHIPADARVASVAVEIGDAETNTVTSLLAFADGSTSVYRSDGTLVEGLSGTPGVAGAVRALIGSIEKSLAALAPAGLISLPQPGRVQFVVRARVERGGEWTELQAIVDRATLLEGSHPLSDAFDRANDVLRVGG